MEMGRNRNQTDPWILQRTQLGSQSPFDKKHSKTFQVIDIYNLASWTASKNTGIAQARKKRIWNLETCQRQRKNDSSKLNRFTVILIICLYCTSLNPPPNTCFSRLTSIFVDINAHKKHFQASECPYFIYIVWNSHNSCGHCQHPLQSQ